MKSERFEMRVPQDLLQRVDAWRREQPDLPPRAEAIRRLLHAALAPGSSDATDDTHPDVRERPLQWGGKRK